MKKRLFAISLMSALVMGLAACGGNAGGNSAKAETAAAESAAETETAGESSAEGETEAAAAGEMKDITLVLDWTPNTNHTGFYVAQSEGYYAEAGLNVNIIQPPEDGATMMVASGQAQFGVDFQDYLAPVFTSEDEIPVTAVAAMIQHNTSGIVSLKEDGIDSPKGLEGKN